jgi:hypothetical protein
MGLPYKYLADKTTFHEIDGIYGNKDARKIIKSSFVKRAILDYLRDHNCQSMISPEVQVELYGKVNSAQVWTVLGLSENATFNALSGGSFNGSEDRGTAVILTNPKTQKRKLLIFTYDDADKAKLLFETPFQDEYDGIVTISAKDLNRKMDRTIVPYNIPVIIYGVNNIFSDLNQKVLYYNGKSFTLRELTNKVVNNKVE